jgi:HSP20 family protein
MMNLVKVNRNPLFSDLFNQMWNDFDVEMKHKPAANIVENDKEFRLEVVLPGWTRDEVKVEIDNDLLKISGERKEEKENDSKDEFLRKEFKKESFERSFTLPKEIDHQKIDAKHQDGILSVIIPKDLKTLEKMKRLISIK